MAYSEAGYGVLPYASLDDSSTPAASGQLILRSRSTSPEAVPYEGKTSRHGPPVGPFEGRLVPPPRRTVGDQGVREDYTGRAARTVLPVVPPDPFVIIAPRRVVPVEPIDPGRTARRVPPVPEEILNIHQARRTRPPQSPGADYLGRVRRTRISPIIAPAPDIRTVPSRRCREKDEFGQFEGRALRQALPQFLRAPEEITIVWPRRVCFANDFEAEHHGRERFRPQPPSGSGPASRPCPPPPLFVDASDTVPLSVESETTVPSGVDDGDTYPVRVDECR